jgi:hypothetical protein
MKVFDEQAIPGVIRGYLEFNSTPNAQFFSNPHLFIRSPIPFHLTPPSLSVDNFLPFHRRSSQFGLFKWG